MLVRDVLAKNRPLRNLHAGRRCFILANGPSLNRQDLSPLRDEVTIAVNNFQRHPLTKHISPKYWLIADPAFWEQPEQYLSPLMGGIADLALSTKFFSPVAALPCLSQVPDAFSFDYHYYLYDGTKHQAFMDIDFAEGIPPFGQNVVVPAIMLALYLGCNPIVLVGCDHDWYKWKDEEDYNLHYTYERFFESDAESEAQEAPAEIYPFSSLQMDLANLSYQYGKLAEYAEKKQVRILNATAGGYLEAFPRVDYDALFEPAVALQDASLELPILLDREALFSDALSLVETERYSTALAVLEQLKDLTSANSFLDVQGTHYLRAICFAKLGLTGLALKALRREVDSHPHLGERVARLSQRILVGGDLDIWEALDCLKHEPPPRVRVPADPEQRQQAFDYLVQKGELELEAGEIYRAIEAFAAAQALEPASPVSANNQGVAFWQAGELNKALACFEEALRLDPQNVDALYNRTELLSQLEVTADAAN